MAAKKQARCHIIEYNSSELKKYALEYGAEYLSDEKQAGAFFERLIPEFKERNQVKRGMLEAGSSDSEIYAAMAQFVPIFILIADLNRFLTEAYVKKEDVLEIKGFLENITKRGSLHHVYFIGCINTDETEDVSILPAYRSMASYRTGMHLGGNLGAQQLYDFQNIHYQDLSKSEKKGVGQTPMAEDETLAQRVIIPLLKT